MAPTDRTPQLGGGGVGLGGVDGGGGLECEVDGVAWQRHVKAGGSLHSF